MSSHVIALLGAESTGKTTLALEVARVLGGRGVDAVMVPEALRDFCLQHDRTPYSHEQAAIAAEQTRRIHEAAQSHSVVVADTTALMIAIYSDFIFDDRSLYASAMRDHAQADLTLLTSLDLAWKADGTIRDGPHVREPVDQLIRQALQQQQLPYNVVAGRGVARVQHALSAIEHLLDAPQRQLRAASSPRWRWYCDNCDDGECEQHGLGNART